MRVTALLVVLVVVAGYGGAGVPITSDTPGQAAEQSPGTPAVENVLTDADVTSTAVRKPEALVGVSLEWVQEPQGVGSQGDVKITVTAERNVFDETLFVSVPQGLKLVSGKQQYDLDLQKGATFTTTVTVEVTENGSHELHVFSSDLWSDEEGTLRGSDVIVAVTPNAREDTRLKIISIQQSSNASSATPSGSDPQILQYANQAPSAATATIDGSFAFERDSDPYGSGLEGSWGARVEIWDADSSGGDEKLKTVYVDENGEFDATVDVSDDDGDPNQLELYLQIYTEHKTVARVEDPGDTVPSGRWPDGTQTVTSGDSWSPTLRATDGEEWLHILRNLMEVWTFLQTNTATGTQVPKETVEWGQQSHGSEHHRDGEMHIGNADGWDDDVIIHEYGHHVMDERYGYTPGDAESHNMNTKTDLDTAWVEGWPTYLEAVVQGVGDYQDIDSGKTVFNWSLETGNQCSGITCEGAVIKALWDIDDGNADSRTGTPYDRKVKLDDRQDRSFAEIWHAFYREEDTELISDGGHHVDTINEFRSNWYDHITPPESSEMVELFALNQLPSNSTVTYNVAPASLFLITTSEPHVGSPVTFNGTLSIDHDGDLQKFEWDANTDRTIDDTGPEGSYTYSTYGEYTVELTVVDNVGATGSSTQTFDVAPAPVCDSCSVPKDPDDDGVYEDVNGDGEVTFLDAYRLYQETLTDDPSPAFDVNGDGEVTFLDAYRLYRETIS